MDKRLYDNNYFIEQLENGREIKVCFMVHNSYWSNLNQLNMKYENCHIDIFGGDSCYCRGKNSYDFLILSSSRFFNDYELQYLMRRATELSNLEGKRVMVGYQSIIPTEERITYEESHLVKILSIKNNDICEETVRLKEKTSTIEFLNLVTARHDELEQQKVMLKK